MYAVSAISWGPWRAEFVEPVKGGHRVRIRPHQPKDKKREPSQVDWIETIVTDDTEAGLRDAIFTLCRERKTDVIALAGNDEWVGALAKLEFADGV